MKKDFFKCSFSIVCNLCFLMQDEVEVPLPSRLPCNFLAADGSSLLFHIYMMISLVVVGSRLLFAKNYLLKNIINCFNISIEVARNKRDILASRRSSKDKVYIIIKLANCGRQEVTRIILAQSNWPSLITVFGNGQEKGRFNTML